MFEFGLYRCQRDEHVRRCGNQAPIVLLMLTTESWEVGNDFTFSFDTVDTFDFIFSLDTAFRIFPFSWRELNTRALFIGLTLPCRASYDLGGWQNME